MAKHGVFTLNVDGVYQSFDIKTWPVGTDLEAITAEVRTLVKEWDTEFAAYCEKVDSIPIEQQPDFESKALPGLCEGGDVWLFLPEGGVLVWHQHDDSIGEWS